MVHVSPLRAHGPSVSGGGPVSRRFRRGGAAGATLAAVALVVAGFAPAASADTSSSASATPASATADATTTTTAPLINLGGSTTTSSTSSTTSTTLKKTTSTTTKAQGAGVPPVPVAGAPTPPTTAPPPGTPTTLPAQPDVAPIVSQVDSDLAQLQAIKEYKPAQTLVATAQGKVTIAGAALLSARQNVQKAQYFLGVATNQKAHADTQLRQLALAAYMGVSFSNPTASTTTNGDQGSGTVSTPFGLTGMSAIDAQELLVLVGQHAKQSDDTASKVLVDTTRTLRDAQGTYAADETAVTGAENGLINAQQALQTVILDATTPGAATAGALPSLQLDDAAQPATTTTTRPTPTTNPDGAVSAVEAPLEDINGALSVSPSILSAPAMNATQIQAWWATLNRQANVTVPINDLITSYDAWGKKLGVRSDIAFAQSIVETGYFSFPAYGQLTAKDNNFAGIGACDTCATGWSFPTADTGVEAQLELLREYATNDPLPAGVQNVIGSTGVGGCCQTWVQLAGKWASSTTYGIAIMTVYQAMLQWLIPQEELAEGLFTPTTTTTTAEGPELAPLPAPPPPPPSSTTSTTKPTPAAAHQR